MNPFSDKWFADIFFHSVCCLCTLLIVSFDVQRFLFIFIIYCTEVFKADELFFFLVACIIFISSINYDFKTLRRRVIYGVCSFYPYSCFFHSSFFFPNVTTFLPLSSERTSLAVFEGYISQLQSFSVPLPAYVFISLSFLKDSFVRYRIHG